MNTEQKEYLTEKLRDIIDRLAYENKEFVCGACLKTKNDIIDIAYNLLGKAFANELNDHWTDVTECDIY